MKWHIVISFFSIIIVVVAPFLFTRTSLCDELVFCETGQIGDTIGGCTAPVIGLISIFLLYLTLKHQLDFNKLQANLQRDEQFKSTLFQLLHQQRDILSSLNERFVFLKKGNLDKDDFTASGQHFFNISLFQLTKIFVVLDNSASYSANLSEDEKNAILESLSENMYTGINLPEDLIQENAEMQKSVNNLMWLNFIVEKFSISESDFSSYKNETDIQKKIKFVYSKFIAIYYRNGYYFRHLYRILKFIDNTEKEEIKNNPLKKSYIKEKYYEYAQFVQAQMSADEMMLVLYNCSIYPKAKELIIKYKILENLYLENLLLKEHAPFGEEFHLAHRPSEFL